MYARDRGTDKETNPTLGNWYLYCAVVDSNKRGIYAPSPDYLECSNYSTTRSVTLTSENTKSRVYDDTRPNSEIPPSLAVTEGNLIQATDFNNLRSKVGHLNSAVQTEVGQRKEHSYYNSLNENVGVVTSGSDINHGSQANLTKIVAQMKRIVKQKSDYYQEDASIMNASKVGTGNEIVTTDLNNILVDTQNLNKDCICFSDCSNFVTKIKRFCICNINCKCNYG